MADFTPVVVRKGDQQRLARTPVELVQFEYDGFTVVREAAKTVAAAGADIVPTRTSRKSTSETDSPE